MVCLTRVHLLGRARVESQRLRARLDEPWPDLQAATRAVLQPAAHLDRHGDVDRSGDGVNDPASALGVVEERRAGAGLRHFSDRAAEVDVDDVRARGRDHARGLGHHPRLRAEDLDRQGMLVRRDTEVAERSLVAVLDPRAGHHLRADEPGPEPSTLPAERLDADPGHRGEHDPRGHLDRPDSPTFAEIDHGFDRVLDPC